jgi:hypothetical protein
MTESMSDALFGVDGTELPPLSRDPTGRGSWGEVSVPPPVPLPAIPELNMTREAIAAALGEDPDELGDQERPAAAVSPPAATAPAAATPAAEPGASRAAGSAPLGASAPSHQQTAIITVSDSSAQSAHRGFGGPGYLRSNSARSHPRVQTRSTRRRVPHLNLPVQTRSNGGAGAFFILAVIVFAILLYFIVSGLVESIARLIP